MRRAPAGGGIAQGGDVGDEPHDEEDRADGEVGRDREHVPHQGRPEVRPEIALVRVRQEEVREPHTSAWMSGNRPAVITAKIVMASAAR